MFKPDQPDYPTEKDLKELKQQYKQERLEYDKKIAELNRNPIRAFLKSRISDMVFFISPFCFLFLIIPWVWRRNYASLPLYKLKEKKHAKEVVNVILFIILQFAYSSYFYLTVNFKHIYYLWYLVPAVTLTAFVWFIVSEKVLTLFRQNINQNVTFSDFINKVACIVSNTLFSFCVLICTILILNYDIYFRSDLSYYRYFLLTLLVSCIGLIGTKMMIMLGVILTLLIHYFTLNYPTLFG